MGDFAAQLHHLESLAGLPAVVAVPHPTAPARPPPRCPQNFLYEKGLQNLPIYTLGISAGAGFATKLPKAFYDTNFGGIIKLGGIISGEPMRRLPCSCRPLPAEWRVLGLCLAAYLHLLPG